MSFCMRRRVVRTHLGRVRRYSQVVVSTRTLRGARDHPVQNAHAPVAGPSPRLSDGARDKTKCQYCPQFSTPPRNWGPPNSGRHSHNLFSRNRELFEALTVVVTFLPFWVGKFRRRAKLRCSIVHHFFPGRQNLAVIRNKRGSKQEGHARDGILSGRRNFGRETKFWPVRGVIGRIAKSCEHELPVRACRPHTEPASAPRGLHGAEATIACHSTGARGCQYRVCYCPSLQGASQTKAKEA